MTNIEKFFKDLAEWRDRYKGLSLWIRETKSEVRDLMRSNKYAGDSQREVLFYKASAKDMMKEREVLKGAGIELWQHLDS